MTTIPISIQLYTVRDLTAKDEISVLRQIAEIGYKGVEIGGFFGRTASEFQAILGDRGLVASAAWTALPTEDNIDGIIETHSPLRLKDFICGFGPNDFSSADDCKRIAEKFQTAAEVCAKRGCSFSFHNHEWEFKPLPDGRLPYDILMAEAPAACSELDVYWAQFGGADAAALTRKYRSRLRLVHVKDGVLAADRSMTAVGSGSLDMPGILSAFDPSVTKWLTVELDACHTDMLEAVRQSYDYLVGSGYGIGNR